MKNCGVRVSSAGENRDNQENRDQRRRRNRQHNNLHPLPHQLPRLRRRHKQAAPQSLELLSGPRRFVSCGRLCVMRVINRFEVSRGLNVLSVLSHGLNPDRSPDPHLLDLNQDRRHHGLNHLDDPSHHDLNQRHDQSLRGPNLHDPNLHDPNLRDLSRHDPNLRVWNHIEIVIRRSRWSRRNRTIYEGSIFKRGSLRSCPSMLASTSPTWVAPMRS